MYEALAIAATGMQAHQQGVDTIANNIANANTTGFKKGRVSFVDLLAAEGTRRATTTTTATATATATDPVGMAIGGGVGISGITKLFDAGELRKTDSPLDLAIDGEGFIPITLTDGATAYTRGGSLTIGKDGLLSTPSGLPLRPEIRIPENAKAVTIARDGRVMVTIGDSTSAVEAGQVQLVRFANPSGLSAASDGIYRATEKSGDAQSGRPGEDGFGMLSQGFVEASNVRMVDEIVNLMLAQRAYEANLKVLQTADEMLGMVNNLRK